MKLTSDVNKQTYLGCCIHYLLIYIYLIINLLGIAALHQTIMRLGYYEATALFALDRSKL